MIILMKGLNEEKMVKPVIGNFHDEDWIDRIIVIDGGSTDLTVHNLKKFSKVEVYIHPWLPWYHDMEVIQSNIALSYLPIDSLAFIMDFDEVMSAKLKETLAGINEKGFPADLGAFSRMSYEPLRHPNSPFAVLDETGFPTFGYQIGQYPDYQCRLIKRKIGMHWINSPHHVMFGTRSLWKETVTNADIIHCHGKYDARDRDRIEMGWLRMQARRNQLGLKADLFECKPNIDFLDCIDPDYWGD